MWEETGVQEADVLPLSGEFKAITTSAHLYHMRAYLVRVEDKDQVTNPSPDEGGHVWKSFDEARDEVRWAYSQLVFEWAKEFIEK